MSVIKVNPGVLHLMDADIDGDQICCILPLSKQSQEDLIKMDVYNFIRENPEHFNPGKELKKYKPEKWATNDFEILNNQLFQICKMSTNGESISYHDCLDDGLHDNYIDNLGINKNELKRITNGIYEEELIDNNDPAGISSAVRSYKTIKQSVAQFGALGNAFMALAIHSTWDLPEEERTNYLDLVAQFKHILSQDGLSAKHGNNKLDTKMNKLLQDMFYRTPDNKLETYEEYQNILNDINLPEKVNKTILNLFWREPLIGINKILDEIVPTFRITRRNGNLGLLDNITELDKENSIQSIMID